MIASPANLQKAAEYLSAKDPVLAVVIASYGPCDLKPHKLYYQELVESIVGQQLSVKAAASIRKRFVELFDDTFPEPAAILAKSIEELRSAGLSGAKANYIRDLAQHVIEGKVVFDKIDQQTNEEVIKDLTDVKGIGEWTAHMFLMFCMARLDILPVGDLGIKNGIQKMYGFGHLPTPDEVKAIAEQNHWHPYESVASWYIWRSLDNKPL